MFALLTTSQRTLICMLGTCLIIANAHAQGLTSSFGATDGLVNLLDADVRGNQYSTDANYRRRHDALTSEIMREIDPAGIIVRNLTVAKLDIDALVRSGSALRAENVLTEFRIAAFPDLVLGISVAKDEQLTEIMPGNIVFTGTARNLVANDEAGGTDWQVMMTLRQSRILAKQAIAVSIQVDSTQGMLVIKPVESLLDDVPDEFLGYHLVVHYKLGGSA